MSQVKARILLVDDDPGIRQLLTLVLERAGHAVAQAGSGQKALELAASAEFEVAFVDLQMPDLSGIEVLQKLRDVQPACSRILLTGHIDLDVALDAVNRGEVMRALTKPMPSAALLSAVREACETRRRLHVAFDAAARAGEAAARTQESARFLECLRGPQVRLAVQPIVRASDFAVVAHEALLRSSHAEWNGPLPLLDTAERLGHLDRLGALVVSRAAEWMPRIPPGTQLFVNLHPGEFADHDALCARLEALAPCADRVVLEITERSQLDHVDEWERTVGRLAAMGFSLALDDLGAGYSSLSLLALLQPSHVKVDMSIIRSVHLDSRKQRLVEVLCRFADATGAKLVAEGVETVEEAQALRAHGVHLLQGYFFGRPSVDAAVERVNADELVTVSA